MGFRDQGQGMVLAVGASGIGPVGVMCGSSPAIFRKKPLALTLGRVTSTSNFPTRNQRP